MNDTDEAWALYAAYAAYAAYYGQRQQAYQPPAAIPAAPSQDEVSIVGYRSRQERDAEARRHAIDVDSESETTPGSLEAQHTVPPPTRGRCQAGGEAGC
eukprot:scaffold30437_cov54-Phaeocystis_antarctica.AAC.3